MNIESKKKYKRPVIKIKKVKLNYFSRFNVNLDESSLLAQLSCFLPGTKILTSKETIKEIERINTNDVVLSYNFLEKKISTSIVNKLITHNEVSSYILINDQIKVTPEHRFWVNNKKWTRVRNILIGDRLLNNQLKPIIVFSLRLINKKSIVYNLKLKGKNHNYFAEGILVHNWK